MVKGRCKYTGYDYGSCALHFFSLPSVYKTSFISSPLLLNKISAGQATTMKTWFRGDNSSQYSGHDYGSCT